MFFRKKQRLPAVIHEFQNLPGALAPEGFEVSFLGALTRVEFYPLPTGVSPLPHVHEELFEYVSLLEAVKEAGEHFTFVECGAGWGRWSCIAAVAARRLAKQYSLHMIEAEPQHVQWITTHMDDNDIRPSHYHVHPYLIGRHGVAPFVVISPDQAMTPRTWYGQATWWGAPDTPGKSEIDYLGHKATMHEGGWGTIDVACRPLHEILADVPGIDFIDMDIQGAEADAIELSIDFLCERVKRLYIGTHTPEVEQRLRRLLADRGWTSKLDFGTATTVETEYGSVAFGDGVQFWINPRPLTAKP